MRVPVSGTTVTPLPSHGLGDYTDQETPDRYLCTIPSRPEGLTALGASACGNKQLNNSRACLPCLLACPVFLAWAAWAKAAKAWEGSHLRTPYWHSSAQPREGIGLEGERAERGEGVRRWAVEVIRLTPYHGRCDSTQRRIIADMIPTPAPRQRRPNRAHWVMRGDAR